jgi:hypothetical protein
MLLSAVLAQLLPFLLCWLPGTPVPGQCCSARPSCSLSVHKLIHAQPSGQDHPQPPNARSLSTTPHRGWGQWTSRPTRPTTTMRGIPGLPCDPALSMPAQSHTGISGIPVVFSSSARMRVCPFQHHHQGGNARQVNSNWGLESGGLVHWVPWFLLLLLQCVPRHDGVLLGGLVYEAVPVLEQAVVEGRIEHIGRGSWAQLRVAGGEHGGDHRDFEMLGKEGGSLATAR